MVSLLECVPSSYFFYLTLTQTYQGAPLGLDRREDSFSVHCCTFACHPRIARRYPPLGKGHSTDDFNIAYNALGNEVYPPQTSLLSTGRPLDSLLQNVAITCHPLHTFLISLQ